MLDDADGPPAVWVQTDDALAAVAEFRAATMWHGSFLTVPEVVTGHDGADEVLRRAAFMLRELPARYSEQMAAAADAVTQGVVDATVADGGAE